MSGSAQLLTEALHSAIAKGYAKLHFTAVGMFFAQLQGDMGSAAFEACTQQLNMDCFVLKIIGML